MLDQDQTEATEIAQLPRNKDGSIRKTFVKSVARRIDSDDASGLRGLVGDLHEADMGALIEALEQEQRPRLVALLKQDRLQLHRADRGRRRGARRNSRGVAPASGGKGRQRARIRRRRCDPRGPAERRAGRDPLSSCRNRTVPRSPVAWSIPRKSRRRIANEVSRRAAGLLGMWVEAIGLHAPRNAGIPPTSFSNFT